jgi:hypothetical protein
MAKRSVAAALTLLLFAPAQAKVPSPQFDLLCEGARGMHLHFRFDLAQGKWCAGPCRAVWAIEQMSDSAIKVATMSTDSSNNWTFVLDRYRSTFAAIHRGYGNSPTDQGQCKPQPFSGFPTKQF